MLLQLSNITELNLGHVRDITSNSHLSCIVLSGRTPKASKSASHFAELNDIIASWSHGRARVPTEWLKSPEEVFRARFTLMNDVVELSESFLAFMSVHDNSMVVIFWPDDKPLPNKTNFSIQRFIDDLRQRPDELKELDGCFAIIGDHTQLAVGILHDDFPKNPKWASLSCEVLICKRSFQNYRHLKSWGILDNVKGQKRTLVSFQSKMLSLHDDMMSLKEQMGDDCSAKDFNRAQVSLKENRKAEYAMGTNSFNQLWTLAAKTGEVWDELRKIFTGEVVNAHKFKKPRSASNFTSMGNIPDEDLLVMLRGVTCGRLSLKQFTDECKAYKATARVQREILSHTDISQESWVDAQEEFPTACDDSFVAIWCQYILTRVLPNKSPLPAEFHGMLQEKIAADRYVQQQDAKLQAVSA